MLEGRPGAHMTIIDRPEKKPRGLRAVYVWMLENAKGRHAWAAVGAFAFAEASFFPIPADVMVLPMMLADRKRVFRLGAGLRSGRWPAACWAMPSAICSGRRPVCG